MISCGSTCDAVPYLSKPLFVILFGNYAEDPSRHAWVSVTPWFPFHKDELNIILDYCVRFIWFPKKSRATFGFMSNIRYLMPNYGGQVVKTYLTTMLLD